MASKYSCPVFALIDGGFNDARENSKSFIPGAEYEALNLATVMCPGRCLALMNS